MLTLLAAQAASFQADGGAFTSWTQDSYAERQLAF